MVDVVIKDDQHMEKTPGHVTSQIEEENKGRRKKLAQDYS